MDPVASGPAGTWTPGEPAGSTAFSPGQVLSARVIQALTGDTYLVAVRGLQLVAQSPQSLALDSVVKLAVQGGGAGEPLRVQLVSGAMVPVPSAPQPAAPAELARQLGLPPGPVTNLVIAAFQEQGAALALPALRQAVRLVGQAQAPPTSLATRAQAHATADLLAAFQPDTEPSVADDPVLAQPPRQATTPLSTPAATPVPIRSGAGDLTAVMPRPAAVPAPMAEPEPLPMGGTVPTRMSAAPPSPSGAPPAAHSVPRPGTAAPGVAPVPSPPAVDRPALPMVVRQTPLPAVPGDVRMPQTLPPDDGEPAAPRGPDVQVPPPTVGRSASPVVGSLPQSLPARTFVVVTPVRSGEAARIYRQQPSTGDSFALRAAVQPEEPAAVATALARLAASPVPVTPVTVHLALAAGRVGLPTLAAQLSASTSAEGSLPVHEVGETPDPVPSVPARPQAGASRFSVPAVAVQAPRVDVHGPEVAARPIALATRLPPTTAEPPPPQVAPPAREDRQASRSSGTPAPEQRSLREPAGHKSGTLAPAAIPVRDLVDLARQPPRQAAETALRLAGLVPQGGGQALTADLGSLLRRLVVLATLPGAANAVAPSVSQPVTHPTPASVPESQPLARVGLAALPVTDTSPVVASPAGPTAPEAPPTGSTSTTMLRDVVAQDLLPPKDLADYDRVLALPLAVQGQPVPARLAVSTRRTADGGLACWMRVDCELSQLGPLSVRLGGADAGPVAITLVTTPAAGPAIAEAITALSEDLRAAGIDAALRVVVDDGSGS